MLASIERQQRIRPSALLAGTLLILVVLISGTAPATPVTQAARISDTQASAAIAALADPLVGSDDRQIFDPAAATFDAFEPATAYDPINNRYLVVFATERIVTDPQSANDNGEDEFEIYGQFVNADNGEFQGTPFRISRTGNDDRCNVADFADAFSPDVAYAAPGDYSNANGTTNWGGGFLVSWVADNVNALVVPNDCNSGYAGYFSNNGYEVYVQLLDADGNLLLRNPDNSPKDDFLSGILAARYNNPETGYPGNPDWDAYSPAVAFNPIDGDFMICWSDDRSAINGSGSISGGAYEIYCKRFQLAPAAGGSRPYFGGLPTGAPYRFSDAGGSASDLNFDAYTPDVAFSTVDREWLIVWSGDDDRSAAMTDNEYEIWGQRVRADGSEIFSSNDQRLSRMGANGSRVADAYRRRWPTTPTATSSCWSGMAMILATARTARRRRSTAKKRCMVLC
ncbi:MAG: hypothetical protein HC822_13875 [Oscillochloris sp.]|nr:hypothetical protein [Oscillochloris sp.]